MYEFVASDTSRHACNRRGRVVELVAAYSYMSTEYVKLGRIQFTVRGRGLTGHLPRNFPGSLVVEAELMIFFLCN